MLATGLIVAYAYILETFTAWYSGNVYENAAYLASHDRAVRRLLLVPDHLQYRGAADAVVQEDAQQSGHCCSSASMVVLIGMWLERFVIIVSSLAQDFLLSSWRVFHRHALGLGDLRRAPSDCSVPVLPVHPAAADDFDL